MCYSIPKSDFQVSDEDGSDLTEESGNSEDFDEQLADELKDLGANPDDPHFQRLVALVRMQRTMGPLPSGQEMMAYKEVDPDLPNRIFKDAEIRRDNRHCLESQLPVGRYKGPITLSGSPQELLLFVLERQFWWTI